MHEHFYQTLLFFLFLAELSSVLHTETKKKSLAIIFMFFIHFSWHSPGYVKGAASWWPAHDCEDERFFALQDSCLDSRMR